MDRGRIYKYIWRDKFSLAGIRKKPFKQIESHTGMDERLVKDLAIEEALQIELKATLSHKNQSSVQRCALSDK